MRLVQIVILLAFGGLASSAFAKCDEMPWKFGMSHEEVTSISECGPYKAFKNGDLETYAGIFDGKAENFQFFFASGKLRRIGIYLYEGKDLESAANRWAGLANVLSRDFGQIETAGGIPPSDASFVTTAKEIVASSGKTQMAPVTQRSDAFVFSSFMKLDTEGDPMYAVILYFNAPQ